MNSQIFKTTAVLFVLTTSLSASALNLNQAIDSTLNNSHEIRELKLQSQSAHWEQIKSYSGFMPKIDLEGRHLFNERFEELEVPFGGDVFVMPAIQPYSSLGFKASWNLFNGFRTLNEVQSANAQKSAADFRLQRLQEQKRAEIRTLFYKALGAQTLSQIADQNLQALDSHLKDVQARIRSGVSTRYDSLRVEVQLEDARTEKVAAESQVVVSRAKLFEAVGMADDGKDLEGKLPEDFSQIDLNKATLQSIQRNDRQALLADESRAHGTSKISQSPWYPSVSLFGTYEWYNNINHSISESDNRFKSAYALGVIFNWNIFDGGATYASQQQAQLAEQIASEKLAQFDQALPSQLEEAQRRFSYDVINYKAKLSSIHKAEEAVRLARSGLRAGTRTNTETLDALIDLNRARASALHSQIDAIDALGFLELTLGKSL